MFVVRHMTVSGPEYFGPFKSADDAADWIGKVQKYLPRGECIIVPFQAPDDLLMQLGIKP